MRKEGELNKGLKLVFGWLAIPDIVRSRGYLDLDKEVWKVLKGLHSYEAAYLLGIETRKSNASLSWLDPIREKLQKHPDYPRFLKEKYEMKTRVQRARAVNQACTDLAETGVLDIVEDKGPHHKVYKANEAIWQRGSVENAKTTISKAHIEDCFSIGCVTLVNHNQLKESGFTVKHGFKGFPLKMCNELREATEGLLEGWVVDWEKRNRVSLASLSEYYDEKMDSLIEKRNKKAITKEELWTSIHELGKEYSSRVPKFPLVVIDLNFEGWPLELR